MPVAAIRRLHLPVDTRPDELAAAQAIGSTDPQKLFDGLVAWVMKTRKYGYDAANGYLLGRVPKLVRMGAVPKTSSVNPGAIVRE